MGVFLASPGGDFLPRWGGVGAAIASTALFSVRVAVLSIPGVTWSWERDLSRAERSIGQETASMFDPGYAAPCW